MVNYQNIQLQKNPVYDIVKYITVAAAVVLIVLIIVGYRKKKELLGKTDFVNDCDHADIRNYLFGNYDVEICRIVSGILLLMPLLGAATLMQIIRNGIAVGTKKRMIKMKKLWIFIGIIVLILVLNHIFGWSSYLGNRENLKFLKQMVQDNLILALLIYSVLTIISCVVLALPGVTFAIIAGLVFGPVLGTICCSVATTLGAMVAFVVGRFFLQDIIKPMAMKNKYLKKWLFDESGNNEVFILMITRLVPLFPYNLQNFAYGVTDIKFSTYSNLFFDLHASGNSYVYGWNGRTCRQREPYSLYRDSKLFWLGL